MYKKVLLTSALAICVAVPAVAEPTVSATFPDVSQDEYMLENYVYTNAATEANLGVTSGSVTANAQYDWDMITVAAGKYLPANSTEVVDCPAGSYCAGLNEQVHWDETAVQGVTGTCAEFSEEFTLSDAGATSSDACYRNCVAGDVANATEVSGKNYAGLTDTCQATECAGGYTLANGICEGNTITITWVGATTANVNANNAGTCTYGSDIRTPVKAVELPGRHFVGWMFSKDLASSVNADDLGTYLSNGELTTAGQQVTGNNPNANDTPTTPEPTDEPGNEEP